eukprot:1170392-Prymnesium_polylepis.1
MAVSRAVSPASWQCTRARPCIVRPIHTHVRGTPLRAPTTHNDRPIRPGGRSHRLALGHRDGLSDVLAGSGVSLRGGLATVRARRLV